MNSPSPLLLATSNAHKVGEIRAIFDACSLRDREDAGSAAGVELISLADAGVDVPEPVEDGETFEANAVIKACYYAAAAKMMCIADDSGLEVDVLAGEPGVLSARYAGEEGPRDQVDRANNRLLLERLGDTPVERRTARFVCAMAWCVPGEPLPRAVVRGTVEGRMLTRDEAGPEAFGRGEHGFGYDPLFFIPELGRTTAELSPAEKNAISHRGKAARLMWREFTHR